MILPTPHYPPQPFTHGAWGLPLVWLDFETYYSTADKYSLTQVTPEEYIRDPRFQVIGVHVICADGNRYTAIGADVRTLLEGLDLSTKCVVSHNNGGFDGLVLTLHYGIRPGAMACTSDMARPHMPPGQSLRLGALSEWAGLPPKGHEVDSADGLRLEDFPLQQLQQYMHVYCPRDTENCWHLYQILRHTFYSYENGPQELEVLSETLLCTVLPHFQDDPVILEEEVARLTKLDEDRERRLLEVFQTDTAGLHKFLGSGKRLAGFLEALGVQVPMKPSKSDPTKLTYAFAKDDEAFTLLATPPEEMNAVLAVGGDAEEDALDRYPYHLEPEMQQLLADVVTARLGLKSSIRRTRAERMLGIAKRGPYGWPIVWRGAGATGRWSAMPSAKTNYQNLPKERRAGHQQEALRRARKAAPYVPGLGTDLVIVSADSAQVEARCVVAAAGQEDMRLMFEQNAPIYEHVAQLTYNKPVGKKDPERQVGKFVTLGAGFGASGGTLYKQMRRAGVKTATPAIADHAVSTYRTNAAQVPKAWRDWNMPLRAIEKGQAYPGMVLEFGPDNAGRPMFRVEFTAADSFLVRLPSGRPLYYRDVRWEYIKAKDAEGWTYLGRDERPDGRVVTARVGIYGAKLFQNWVQAVSCDFIAYAAWLMRKHYGHTMAGNAHDELTYVAPRVHAPLVKEQLLWCMRQRPNWMPMMPLDAEGAIGESYADV